MNRREQFLAIAKTWEGVPWAKVGSDRERGVNCLGLVVGIARECGFLDNIAEKEGGASFVSPPTRGAMLARALEDLDLIKPRDALPGDLVLYRIAGEPQHLTVVVNHKPLMLLHSDYYARKCIVTPPLMGWNPCAYLRIRELANE